MKKTLPDFSGRRVVIFTDEQVHDSAYDPLRKWKRQDPDRSVHVVNVAGYSPLAFPERGVTRLGGWSERLFEVLALLEARDPVAWIRSGGWQTTASVSSAPEDEEEER